MYQYMVLKITLEHTVFEMEQAKMVASFCVTSASIVCLSNTS